MKMTKAMVDSNLRNIVFSDILDSTTLEYDYEKINDRQYGVILTDLNGNERYCRIGVIVAEEREDITARELMAREINDYHEKQLAKAQREQEKQAKIARDKERREKEKNEEEGE